MMTDTINSIDHRYPFPMIVGLRQTRKEARVISDFALDSSTANRLGIDNIGVFVGGLESNERLFGRLRRLAETPYQSRWMVLFPSKQLVVDFREAVGRIDKRISTGKQAEILELGNAIITTPERLTSQAIAATCEESIAGIVVADPTCYLFKQRGLATHNSYQADRPQMIVDYRARLAVDLWQPPLLFLTNQDASACYVDRIRSAFSLDAWWFLCGHHFGIRRGDASFVEKRHDVRPSKPR